jgi:hypothetical protein
MSQVRITSTGVNAAVVEVDGQDLAKYCRAATVTVQYGEVTTLALDMVLGKGVRFEGDAVVQLDSETEAFLTRLGWTPPEA